MAEYTLAEYGVTRTSDRASIPADDRNRDWRAYQEWLADGNIPDPMPVVEPVVVATPTVSDVLVKIANGDPLTEEDMAVLEGME